MNLINTHAKTGDTRVLMNIIKGLLYRFSLLSPLTTDDAIWRHQTLAACYQFVLKIAFELAKKAG